jgi:hypothetical protein
MYFMSMNEKDANHCALFAEEHKFVHNRVQTGTWSHPTSFPMGTGILSAVIKRPGREAVH